MHGKQLVHGRLVHDQLADTWSILDQDGKEHQIQLGERVGLGTMYGIAVYGCLVATGAGGTSWAITELPSKPISGAYASVWRPRDAPAGC